MPIILGEDSDQFLKWDLNGTMSLLLKILSQLSIYSGDSHEPQMTLQPMAASQQL